MNPTRQLWQVLEAYHGVVYFDRDAKAAYEDVGLKGYWMGYFASRAAPLGPAPPEVVTALFYNFSPSMVERAIPDAWRLSSPQDVIAARYRVADSALRKVLGDPETETEKAAKLARELVSHCSASGRALFAAYQALEWPEGAHLVLWHAATLWREYRGDGHVAALVTHEIDGCEANLLASAAGVVTDEQRSFRGWTEDEWSDATRRLQRRGLLDSQAAFTAEGKVLRQRVEDLTDRLSSAPVVALGEERVERLIALLEPICTSIADARVLPYPNAMGLTRLTRSTNLEPPRPLEKRRP